MTISTISSGILPLTIPFDKKGIFYLGKYQKNKIPVL